MWPDRVSNCGPLTYKSGALRTALRGLAQRVTTSLTNCLVPWITKPFQRGNSLLLENDS